MKKIITIIIFLIPIKSLFAQTNPIITSWLQNNSITGTYYMNGNPNLIQNNILVNCQSVAYSNNWVYIKTKGIPAYPTGPFLDRNPSIASDQNRIIKLSLTPQVKTAPFSPTTGGNIGMFINGVALFDYRDGVAWNSNTNSLCGGPGNPPCPGGMGALLDWNRDAILAERMGFDCAKGHPAMGNYHHHQNPSAFKLDLTVISNVCNLYDADGLYQIDSTKHSPLIGFAYDGYPIYGSYAYKNNDGTGGIVRIKSSYQLRNISSRTTSPKGNSVPAGPMVSSTYPLGYFREDYEFINHSTESDYLDEHNGRFSVTPEYPKGTYAYFATVDAKWNSAYPYVVGPTYYGVVNGSTVPSINEPVTIYNKTTNLFETSEEFDFNIFSNEELIIIQSKGIIKNQVNIELFNISGQKINESSLNQGQSISYLDIQNLYSGTYFIKLTSGKYSMNKKLVIKK